MFRRYLQRCARAVIWAMIPLTFVGSTPRLGCLCANGDHKLFCSGDRRSSIEGQGSCCARESDAAIGRKPERHAPSSATSCCRKTVAARGNSPGRFVKSGASCRTVLDVPQLWTTENGLSDVDPARQFMAMHDTAAPQTVGARSASHLSRHRGLPPPEPAPGHRVLLI
jgi:hypothetical protein